MFAFMLARELLLSAEFAARRTALCNAVCRLKTGNVTQPAQVSGMEDPFLDAKWLSAHAAYHSAFPETAAFDVQSKLSFALPSYYGRTLTRVAGM